MSKMTGKTCSVCGKGIFEKYSPSHRIVNGEICGNVDALFSGSPIKPSGAQINQKTTNIERCNHCGTIYN